MFLLVHIVCVQISKFVKPHLVILLAMPSSTYGSHIGCRYKILKGMIKQQARGKGNLVSSLSGPLDTR